MVRCGGEGEPHGLAFVDLVVDIRGEGDDPADSPAMRLWTCSWYTPQPARTRVLIFRLTLAPPRWTMSANDDRDDPLQLMLRDPPMK